MNAERWEEVARIFALVTDEGGADRETILDRECAGDPELRREMEALLEADAKSVRDVAAMVAGAVHELAGPLSVPSDAGERALRDLGLSVGDRIDGRYEVTRLLGAGAMGVVVAARHAGLDETVAIKLLSPDALATERVRRRFLREAKAAARLRSPHVVKVRDVGVLPTGAPYLVMDLLEGTDLAAVLRARGRLPYPEVCRIALQTCEALAAAHVRGIVHRDIKPGNLFLERAPHDELTVTLLDFGISKIGDAGDTEGVLTRSTDLVGSPAYMSPEQLRASGSVDARSDIWSLGVVLFEMLVGARPFRADNLADISLQILSAEPPVLDGHAPPSLIAVVRRCLEKDRSARYGDVGELATALAPFFGAEGDRHARRVLATLGGPVPDDAAHEELTMPAPDVAPSRTWWAVSIAAAVLALALGAGALLLSRSTAPGDSPASPPNAPAASTARESTALPSRETRQVAAAPNASGSAEAASSVPSAAAEVTPPRTTRARPPSDPKSAPPAVDPYATRR